MKRDPIVLVVVGAVASLMLLFGVYMSRHRTKSESRVAAKGSRQEAHDFTLKSMDGRTIHLSDFKGEAVLLNFWETTCEPCKIETPWLVEFQKQYGSQGLQILGVSMDNDDLKEVAAFVKTMAIDYPILVGKESETDVVANAYGGIAFLPQTFVISRDGKIIGRILGLESRSEIENEIRMALGQAPVAQVQRPASLRSFMGSSLVQGAFV